MSHYQFDTLVQFNRHELDIIYQKAFGYKNDGVFVEVGAYNGRDYSHTCGLADIGWRGIYIEPVPDLADACRMHHNRNKNVVTVCCAAGAEPGVLALNIDEHSCCGSTLNPSVCKQPQTLPVPVLPLDLILQDLKVEPEFDLLSIDVEFYEMEVLKGFNLAHWLPKLIIIELCEMHDEPKHTWAKPARDYCETEFPKYGYEKIFADAINTVFLRTT